MTDGDIWITWQAGCKQDKEKIMYKQDKVQTNTSENNAAVLPGKKTIPESSSLERFWGSL